MLLVVGVAARRSRRGRRSARARRAPTSPNVGIAGAGAAARDELEVRVDRRIARAVSAASRPYSSAVLWPICHGPSISLPRHHIRMPCGSVGAVGRAQVGQRRAGGVVGVLEQVERLLDAAGAEVDRHHRLDAGLPAPADELVEADLVRSRASARPGRAGAGVGRAGRRRPPSGSRTRSCRPDSGPSVTPSSRIRSSDVAAEAVRVGASGGRARRCPV